MNKSKKIIIGIAVVALIFLLLKVFTSYTQLGGQTSKASTFRTAATSGLVAVTSDAQILATSSIRAYASICNNSSQVVYLGMNQDIALNSGSTNSSRTLTATGSPNNCYEINVDNLYVGAIRASSTDETSSNLIISEYNSR